jgi:AcrR family transcriptional regulator
MEQDKTVREPQQKRSRRTKEKILNAAYHLFCTKGYYKTTTNEIARVADVSIGSLYSYFKDKETILLEILDRFNDSFNSVSDKLSRDMELYRTDPRAWFRRFMEGMIEVHQMSKELNREMKFLCFSMPEVAAVMERQHEKTREMNFNYFYLYQEFIKVEDVEAAAIVTFNLIDSVVDQIVFCENQIDDERIVEAGVDALCKFLMN